MALAGGASRSRLVVRHSMLVVVCCVVRAWPYAKIAPLYPAEARRDGRSGIVTMEFVVNEAGEVTTPRITGASDLVFEAAALRAVAKWRFEPGRRHGQIVRFRMVVPIHFSLNE